MKATELRIGNLVDRGDCICTIEKLDREGALLNPLTDKHDLSNEQPMKPIPLTEEWLVKFGWQKIKHEGRLPYGYIHGSFISMNDENYWEIELGRSSDPDRNQWVKLYHVHQLQNLYFALTGTELTIKP